MMWVTRKTHEAALAAKDAEIARWDDAHGDLQLEVENLHEQNSAYASQNADLRARLAKFTGPRQRGQGGRFLPVNGEVAS